MHDWPLSLDADYSFMRLFQFRFQVPVWLFVILLGFPGSMQSQPPVDSILSLSPEDQLKYVVMGDFWSFYQDSLKVIDFFTRLEKGFESKGNDYLAEQAWMTKVTYAVFYYNVYTTYAFDLLDRFESEARGKGRNKLLAELAYLRGNLYFMQNVYPAAAEFMRRGYNQMKANGFEYYARIHNHLENMGKFYYELGDQESALHYLREALSIPRRFDHPGPNRGILNTIGVCYNQLEKYDSAIIYLDLTYQESVEARDTFWAALAKGNKGYALYKLGRYDEAIPLMEEDFRISIEKQEWYSAANAAMSLANVMLLQKRFAEAAYYVDYMKTNRHILTNKELPSYYRNLAEINRLKGHYAEALSCVDSFFIADQNRARELNTQMTNKANLKVEVEQYAHEIAMLEAARGRQVLLRNGLLIILILSAIIATLVIRQQQLKRQREMQLADMREQSALKELDNARAQLRNFTQALREKNELVDQFRTELDHLRKTSATIDLTRADQVDQLLHATILTEEDWKEFRILFEKVYPGFFLQLKERLGDLTPAENRILALTKLQLSPKEMAAMLGITYDAIKKTRQRLRKKIDLPEEGSLDELVDFA